MEARCQGELEEEFKPLRRGWCLGSKTFRADMLKHVEAQEGKWHYGEELRESAQAKAERLIGEALRSGGVTDGTMTNWRKGHPFKVNLAHKLRAETIVTIEWIAQRPQMGSRGHVAHLLCKSKSVQSVLDQPCLGI
jgi:hypothetical protein